MRHATQLRLLEGLGCTLPELLKVWHYMSRGGFPESQWPALRSLMGSDHNLESAKKAAVRMFGSESMPDGKTLEVTKRTLIMKIDGKKAEEVAWYGEDAGEHYEEEDAWWSSEWDDDAYYYEEWPSWQDYEEAYVEEGEEEVDVPEELEKLAEETDELLITWMDSRKKMNELARSRGFYPVMAVPPELAQSYGGGGARSAPKGKGKGKSGKGKGKQKGKGGKSRRPFRPAPKGFGKGGGQSFPKRTTSGSTFQHGPRFKRLRNDKPAEGGSEANFVEEINMLEESWSEDESPEVPAPVGRASDASAASGSARAPEVEAKHKPRRKKPKKRRTVQGKVKREKDEGSKDAEKTKNAEKKPETEAKDFWRTCGNRVIRVHMKPRKKMFCPYDVDDCPTLSEHLENRRTTERTDLGGDCVIDSEDCWRASSKAHLEHMVEWQGHSTFYVKPDAGVHYEWYSPGTPESVKNVVRVPESRRNEPGVARWPIDGEYYIIKPLEGEREYELEERIRAGREAEEESRMLRETEAELKRRRAETGRRIRERQRQDSERRRESSREEHAMVAEEEAAQGETIEKATEELDLLEDGRVRGVVDSGCTTTVCGKDVWKAFLKQRRDSGENGVEWLPTTGPIASFGSEMEK